jgi:hypothetical protein
MLEPELISRIRHIFLHPGPHVSITQATRLLGWSRRQMSDAIESVRSSCGRRRSGTGFRGRR